MINITELKGSLPKPKKNISIEQMNDVIKKHDSKNTLSLFYKEKGKGDLTFLCIHNTGGDHRIFIPQLKYFSKFGRVILPDLRGHGKSDKPKGEYSIEVFGDDLVHLCKELSLKNVIAIGSSTGGNIALALACRYPQLVKTAIMIDCAMFLSPQARKVIQGYKNEFQKGQNSALLQKILNDSCLPTDRCKNLIKEAYKSVPSYVWEGAFASLLKWDRDNKTRLQNCKAPILYIQASSPTNDRSQLANFQKFYKYYPPLITGKVVGSGHYPSLEVPDQINAMILRFLQIKNFLVF